MRNFTHRWPQSGHFVPKLGYFFPISEKGQGRPPTPPPPSSYAPASNMYTVFILYICAVRYTYPIDKWFRKPSKHGHYRLLCDVFTKDLYKGLKYKIQITEKLALHGRNSLEWWGPKAPFITQTSFAYAWLKI